MAQRGSGAVFTTNHLTPRRQHVARRLRRWARRGELRLAHLAGSIGVRAVSRAFPARIRPNPPRHAVLGDPSSLQLDGALARPIHLPDRCRGSLHLAGPPPGETRALRRLVRRAQRRCDVEAPTAWAIDPNGAAALITLGAAGAPVRLVGTPVGPSPIGPDTLATMAAPNTSPDGRDLRSVRLRRAALSEHGGRSPTTGHAGASASISVLLASRRPDDVLHAVEQVARQRAVDLQLVVGLHGAGFAAAMEGEIASLWHGELRVLRLPAAASLGEVLNEMSAVADRELVTKWDDDDWYGVDHLLDLVLAYDYSGAEVVGKFAEFVHLEQPDVTIRRSAPGSESYTTAIAGGTLLMSREWLRRIGGWPSVPRNVDLLLIDSTRQAGGRCYRTHGYQYVLRRRAGVDEHTWAAPSEYFAADSVERRPGLDLAFADIEAP